MQSSIHTFGCAGTAMFTIERDAPEHGSSIRRELWFDRDIDGRWLVCAVESKGRGRDGSTGAVVVTDPRVADFIETLAHLIDDPAVFHDEPDFHSPH